MSLIPTPAETLARARTDLRLGLPVVLQGNSARAFVTAAEGITDDRLSDLTQQGPSVLAITAWRAETLRARAYDGDVARLALPSDVNADWLRAAADPKDDLNTPMKGPFVTERDGDATLHRLAIRLVKSAHLLPAALVTPIDAPVPDALTHLDADQTSTLLDAPAVHTNVVSGRVPLHVSEAGRVHVFRPDNGGEEHFVCEIGRPPRDAPVPVSYTHLTLPTKIV